MSNKRSVPLGVEELETRSLPSTTTLPTPLLFIAGNGNAIDTISGKVGTMNTQATFGDGIRDQAFKLFDPHAQVLAPDVPAINFERTQAFTVSTWAKVDLAHAPAKSSAVLFEKGDNDNGKASYGMSLRPQADGTFFVDAWLDAGGGNAIFWRSVTVPMDANWHNFTMSYDGSSKAAGVKIYVDGKSLASDYIQDTLGSGSIKSSERAQIGSDASWRDAGNTAQMFSDETKVFGQNLSLEQIIDSMALDRVTAAAAPVATATTVVAETPVTHKEMINVIPSFHVESLGTKVRVSYKDLTAGFTFMLCDDQTGTMFGKTNVAAGSGSVEIDMNGHLLNGATLSLYQGESRVNGSGMSLSMSGGQISRVSSNNSDPTTFVATSLARMEERLVDQNGKVVVTSPITTAASAPAAAPATVQTPETVVTPKIEVAAINGASITLNVTAPCDTPLHFKIGYGIEEKYLTLPAGTNCGQVTLKLSPYVYSFSDTYTVTMNVPGKDLDCVNVKWNSQLQRLEVEDCHRVAAGCESKVLVPPEALLPKSYPMGSLSDSMYQRLGQDLIAQFPEIFDRGTGKATLLSNSNDIAIAIAGNNYLSMSPQGRLDFCNGIEQARNSVWAAFEHTAADEFLYLLKTKNGIAVPVDNTGINDGRQGLAMAQIPNLPSRQELRAVIYSVMDKAYAIYARLCADSIAQQQQTSVAAAKDLALYNALGDAGLRSVQTMDPVTRSYAQQVALDKIFVAVNGSPDRAGWTQVALARFDTLVAAEKALVANGGTSEIIVPISANASSVTGTLPNIVTPASWNESMQWFDASHPIPGGIFVDTNTAMGRILAGYLQQYDSADRNGTASSLANKLSAITGISVDKILVASPSGDATQRASALQNLMTKGQFQEAFSASAKNAMDTFALNRPSYTLSDKKVGVRFDVVLPSGTTTYDHANIYVIDPNDSSKNLGGPLTSDIKNSLHVDIPLQSIYDRMPGVNAAHIQLRLQILLPNGQILKRDTDGFIVDKLGSDLPTNWAQISSADQQKVLDLISNFKDTSNLDLASSKIVQYAVNNYFGSLKWEDGQLIGAPHGTGDEQCKAWLQKLISEATEVTVGNNINNFEWAQESNVKALLSFNGNSTFSDAFINSSNEIKNGDIVQMDYNGGAHTVLVAKIQNDGLWVLDTNFSPKISRLADADHEATGLIENGKYRNATAAEKAAGLATHWQQDDNTIRMHFMTFEDLNLKVSNATAYRISQ